MLDQIEQVIRQDLGGRPVAVGVEQPNSFRNGRTTRQLCGAFGVVMWWLTKNGMAAYDLSKRCKKVFCGRSNT